MVLAWILVATLQVSADPPSPRPPASSVQEGDELLAIADFGKHCDVAFDETPVGRVFEYLGALAAVRFRLSPGLDDTLPVTLELRAVPIRDVLRRLAAQHRLRYVAITDAPLTVMVQAAARTESELNLREIPSLATLSTFELTSSPTRDFFELLGEMTGVTFVLEGPGLPATVTLRLRMRPAAEALEQVARDHRLIYRKSGDRIVVTSPR